MIFNVTHSLICDLWSCVSDGTVRLCPKGLGQGVQRDIHGQVPSGGLHGVSESRTERGARQGVVIQGAAREGCIGHG